MGTANAKSADNTNPVPASSISQNERVFCLECRDCTGNKSKREINHDKRYQKWIDAVRSSKSESKQTRSRDSVLQGDKSQLESNHILDERYQKWIDAVRPSRSLNQPRSGDNVLQVYACQDTAPTTKCGNTFQPPNFNAPNLDSPRSLRRSLYFAGNIPDDWNVEQQAQLEYAVAEVAHRLKIRPPGFRAMQQALAAHKRGDRTAACAHGTRFATQTFFFLCQRPSRLQI